ncbi:MAG TPA: hypothetical protein VFZ42_05285 [Chitinophagaceae bacterium]
MGFYLGLEGTISRIIYNLSRSFAVYLKGWGIMTTGIALNILHIIRFCLLTVGGRFFVPLSLKAGYIDDKTL